jgi:hypothetical protein
VKRRQLSEDMADTSDEESQHDERVSCPVCNTIIEFYWESKYNGIRGRCNKCKTNWAES